ncbi:MAG: type II secretion system protein N [Desulfobacteraceae bacterium]|jgi:general secretion pathway protein C|nr:type II secretion system protein N [Desulfobacteraceae bacterium]
MVYRYFAIANILLLTVVVFLVVNTFYAMVTAQFDNNFLPASIQPDSIQISPPVDEPPSISQYSSITNRNLFNLTAKKVTAAPPLKIDLENLKQTNLKLKLWGTVTCKNSASYAVIEDLTTRRQNLYRIGDSFQEVTVKKIYRDKIILIVNGSNEILTMEKPVARKRRFQTGQKKTRSPRLPVSYRSRRIMIDRKRLESTIESSGQLRNQANLRPYIRAGRPDGIAISRIKPNSIFRRMRLRNGDIITGVNGRSVESVEDVIAIFENLTVASGMQVDITRRRQKQRLDYQIK